MRRIKILCSFLLFTSLLSGCVVSKSDYDRKVLASRNLSRRLENSRKRNNELEAKIKSLEVENSDLKADFAGYQTKIGQLVETLDEKERAAETISSNLSREMAGKDEEVLRGLDILKNQGEEVNKLRAANIELTNQGKDFLDKITRYEKDIKDLKGRVKELTRENQDIITIRLAQVKEIKELMKRTGKLESALQKKKARLENIKKISQKMEKSLQKEIQAEQAKVINRDGKIHILFVTDLLFDSKNISSLKKDGRKVLMKIGSTLKGLKGKKITVAGHTDDRGISLKLKDRFPSNWDLSVARAVSVVRYLVNDLKINPQLLSSAGYSSFSPIADNKTEHGRAKNRRIEIIISSK